MAATIVSPTPKVVPLPIEARPQIHQFQLERIIALRNQVAGLAVSIETAEAEVKAALESGATVEPGTHVVSLKEIFRRCISWRDVAVRLAERLYGEGRGHAYAENVLQNSKASKVVSLIVS